MAKPPKDPARPTRAKASRETLPPIAPALEALLNPGIARGEAGLGSQTGREPRPPSSTSPLRGEIAPKARVRGAQRESSTPSPADAARRRPLPPGERRSEPEEPIEHSEAASRLQPPPDNSRDRRADFSAAHTAR
ncbi:hypothetical protein ABTU92_14525, partial [Rhodoplanes sp. SY1]